MKITWIGHACFLIEAEGTRLVADPFDANVPYPFPPVSADIVTVSHEHADHNATHRVSGKPTVVRGPGRHRVGSLDLTGIASSHDATGGSQRGQNTIFAITFEGLRLAHLGDLGARLDDVQRSALRSAEILFVPVGGTYTIDAQEAADVVRSLPGLRVVFPMHYRTSVIADWPLTPVDEFLRTMDNVRHIESSGVELTRATLPETLEVWALRHA